MGKTETAAGKIEAFLGNARLLGDTFGIAPLLYGSLGLEYLTGEDLRADDIDILIPRTFLKERWMEFKTFLEKNGYTLTDEHEHTFQKGGVSYSYAQIEELEAFAGIPMTEITIHTAGGVSFGLLSLRQYLAVYTASSQDGYRIKTREKKDFEKIAFLKRRLQ